MSSTLAALRRWLITSGLAPNALGRLERQVMDAVGNARNEVSVREVRRALAGLPAYTTVMTTLDRLHKKGLLTRRKRGRAFLYQSVPASLPLEDSTTRELLAALVGDSRAARPMLHTLVDVVSARDQALLDELERLVQLKRRELGGKK